MAHPDPLPRLKEALAHHHAGRLEQAARLYADVRRIAPRNFDAWHLGGVAAHHLGRQDEAGTLLARALQLSPESAPAWRHLGLVQLAKKDFSQAEASLRRSLARDAKSAESWQVLSIAQHNRGCMTEALHAAEQAARLRPDAAALGERVAALTADLHGFRAALPLLEAATKRWPDHAPAWKNLGVALASLHEPLPALAALDRALTLDPAFTAARLGRAMALLEAFRISEAITDYDAVLAREPAHPEAGSARLFALNYRDDVTPEILWEAHQTYGRVHGAVAPRTLPPITHSGPLRVAFLSPDLRRHAVASFLEPLLVRCPSDQFEVWLYHDHAIVDDVSGRLKTLGARWRNFAGQPNAVVEAAILADAPDVIIELAGHTGSNRLPVLARRVAPVQINYLGYPNTTGLAAMDFRFTDDQADPAGAADARHSEQLVRFAPCAWVYQPPADAPEPPAGEARAFTFGSFNNPAKLSARNLRVWADVLRAVPGSRLLLKGHGLDAPRTREDFAARFAEAGGDSAQLDMLDRVPSARAHLELYGRVDVALDPFPYHGTTTTCEALWMGRPVVTLAGEDHRSRVGVSLLTAAGHPEWIARDEADYVGIAARLAVDPVRLSEISRGLRDDLSRGPLLDHAGQAARFWRAVQACAEHAGAVAAEAQTIHA
jgi:protein O-GlcNAc transferase